MTARATRKEKVFLLIVVTSAVALYLRLVLALNGGFYRDEGLLLFVVKLPSWNSMIDFLRFHESHPPLFYAVMRIWTSAMGVSETAAVLPAVVFGVALIPLMFVAGAHLFSTRAGIVAGSLAALSPSLIEYSAAARPYSLLSLLTLISAFAMIRGFQTERRPYCVAYVLSTIGLLYTHNWSWLVLFGEWAAALIVTLLTPRLRDKASVANWLTANSIILFAYLPWLTTFLYQSRHAGHGPSVFLLANEPLLFVIASVKQLLEATLLGFASANARRIAWMPLFYATPLLLLVVGQYLRVRAARMERASMVIDEAPNSRDERITVVCLLVIPATAWLTAMLLSGRTDVLWPRCLTALAPLVLLALAHWLSLPRAGVLVAVSRITLATLFVTYFVALYQLLATTRSNARELAAAVSTRAQQSDIVVISPEWLASSFNWYYRAPNDQIDFPAMAREGAIEFTNLLNRFRDERPVTEAFTRLHDARAHSRRVWLVTDRDQSLAAKSADVANLIKSGNYTLAGVGRTMQLRAELDSLYGNPLQMTAVSTSPPRYEMLRAFLYSPR